MNKLPLSALVAAAALQPAFAAEQADRRLDTVVVTANRIAETADQTLAPVSVVTREDIERLQPQSMADLLRVQPGLSLVRDGGLSGTTSLFLRGTESDHVLVLIDGVRASSATSGNFSWRSLNPAQVERIEIVRGPRATLYGSEAIGGVIQIFTRRPAGVTAQVEAGSFGTRSASAGFSAGTERVRLGLTASAIDSDGFDATEATTWGHDDDDDGFEERSLSARLNATLSPALALTLSGWHSEGEAEFDQGVTDLDNDLLNARLDWDVTASWSQRLQLGYSRDEQVTRADFPAAFRSSRRSVEWQNDLVLGQRHLLTAGLSHVRDSGKSIDRLTDTTQFDESVETDAAFANLLLDFGAHNLQLGLRHDDHSQFGGQTTGQLAWGWQLSPAWRTVASYGTAFKAPTLNDLYYPGLGGLWAGNPELEPEQSETAELSLRYRPAANRYWEASAYYTEIDDLISTAAAFPYGLENVDRARIRGVELVHGGDAGPWHWQANLTAQRARNVEDDSRLISRPDEKLALVLGRDIGAGQVQADWVLVNHRESIGGVDLAGYGLLNLSASYPLARSLSLTGRVENLGDTDYRLIDGYNTADRAYYVGLRYQPQ